MSSCRNFCLNFWVFDDVQILGYGWAGILRRFLVDPVEMWWPSNLAQVSLFRYDFVLCFSLFNVPFSC